MTSTKTIFVIERSIRKLCESLLKRPSLIQLRKANRKKARRPHKFILDCCYGEDCGTRRDLAFACRKRLRLFATSKTDFEQIGKKSSPGIVSRAFRADQARSTFHVANPRLRLVNA